MSMRYLEFRPESDFSHIIIIFTINIANLKVERGKNVSSDMIHDHQKPFAVERIMLITI